MKGEDRSVLGMYGIGVGSSNMLHKGRSAVVGAIMRRQQ